MITGIEEKNGQFKVWAQAGGVMVWWTQPTENAACQNLNDLKERIQTAPDGDMTLTAVCEFSKGISPVSFLELA